MLNKYYEMLLEIAADGEDEQSNVDSSTETVDTTATNTDDVDGGDSTDDATDDGIDIDGEKFTLEQIREWKQGNMRQSDYTKKTQEIAAQRKEAKDALDIYNFIKENPELLDTLAKYEPTQAKKIVPDEIRNVQVEVNAMKIEMQLNQIKSIDKDVDELGVLEIANREGIDVDKAYKLWKGENFDSIMQKKLAEQSKTITEKIKTNNEKTKTLISPNDKSSDSMFGLSQVELEYANKLGMSPEEYAKWK